MNLLICYRCLADQNPGEFVVHKNQTYGTGNNETCQFCKRCTASLNNAREENMINLEYFDGNEWVQAGGPFGSEHIAWISLGGDDINYRTVDADTGEVLTDKSQ